MLTGFHCHGLEGFLFGTMALGLRVVLDLLRIIAYVALFFGFHFPVAERNVSRSCSSDEDEGEHHEGSDDVATCNPKGCSVWGLVAWVILRS